MGPDYGRMAVAARPFLCAALVLVAAHTGFLACETSPQRIQQEKKNAALYF